MSQTPIHRLDANAPDFSAELGKLLAFEAAANEKIETAVTEILRAVRTRGDVAVLEYTRRFDGLEAGSMAALELPKAELQAALASLAPERRDALRSPPSACAFTTSARKASRGHIRRPTATCSARR